MIIDNCSIVALHLRLSALLLHVLHEVVKQFFYIFFQYFYIVTNTFKNGLSQRPREALNCSKNCGTKSTFGAFEV